MDPDSLLKSDGQTCHKVADCGKFVLIPVITQLTNIRGRRNMNSILYTLRYLSILAHTGYEENYWNQVFINDLWVNVLHKYLKEQSHD